MTATVERTGFEVDAIDVFCGYGGSSQGIHAAGATVRAAANHSELAIECHAANFPDTDHWQADMVDSENPQVVDRRGKKVSGSYLDPKDLPRARFAWFSPSCTHHSQANAKKVYERGYQLAMLEDDDWDAQEYVNSERSRVTMSCVLRYAAHNRPEILAVENVIEVTKWGPGRNGDSFRWWLRELDNLGYAWELCFFNSMFFPPCPQSRDRIYIVAWKKGNTAPDLDYRPTAYCTSDACSGRLVDAVQTFKRPTKAWMGFPKWGKYGAQYDYRCPDCRAPVHPASWMALSAINWSNLGPTLAERKDPLADNTLERIRRAIKKYWWAPPVLLPPETAAAQVSVQHDGGDRSRHVSDPLPTRTNKNGEGIATVVPLRSGRPRSNHPSDPLSTLVADGSRQALTLMVKNNGAVEEAGYRGHHASGPFGSVTKHPAQSLVALVPNRTHNDPKHSSESAAPVMTSATQGVASAALPILRGDHDLDRHPGEPTTTVSAGGTHQAVATAMWSKINGGPDDTAWHPPTDPLNTVTQRDTHGLVLLPWVDQWRSEPALITEQLATVTSHLRQSLASIEPFDGEITDEMLMQVRFRMLEPDPELRRAMAFADDYQLLGNKTQMTAGLGNAVTPPVSRWIVDRCLDTLRGSP